MPLPKYPKISVRGKNELAKDISDDHFLFKDAMDLIADAKSHFNKYWKDNLKRSKPKDGKWTRSAYGTPLGALLNKINTFILVQHDVLIPRFIFGGVKGRSHIQATQHLQGIENGRTLLKLDVKGFFEQITEERVVQLLVNKCQCSHKGARLIASLCCVPLGKKDGEQSQRAIARGFATSSRLAVWCSLDLFIKMDKLVQRRLKGKDPRISVYVDDIGISATRTKKAELLVLSQEIAQILQTYKRPLYLNHKKTEIVRHDEGMEHLGTKMNRHDLSLGKKTFAKKIKITRQLPTLTGFEKIKAKTRLRSILLYEQQVKNSKPLPE